MQEKYFGAMLDMSRNAVMKIEQIKKYVDYLKEFGYNMLMLYTEDTYEVDNEPYFGYLRGRYSKDELKEIDAYCLEKGIELIPCVQTLAHLKTLFRWPVYYRTVRDCIDVLLVDEERTYTLIDNIFATLEQCFTTRVAHVGMDEAYFLGAGAYRDKHGPAERAEMLKRHLSRVREIAQKHGFTILTWSDMFFNELGKGDYYTDPKKFCVSDEEKKIVPDGVQLVYWDYYSTQQNKYERSFKNHKKITDNVWYAGGIWSWYGFAPINRFSLRAMGAAMKACRKSGMEKIFITIWGDDGGECPKFSLLPVLYYSKRIYDGETSIQKIKAEFKEIVGESFDAMLQMDAPNEICGNKGQGLPCNPSRYMFYSDLFSGYFDANLPEGGAAEYKTIAKRLQNYARGSEKFGYIYGYLAKLCDFMSVKYDLGVRLRAAYQAEDKTELQNLVGVIRSAEIKLDKFYDAFKTVWYTDNKPYGFEIQDARMGALSRRMRACRERLQAYLKGDEKELPELGETLLDYFGNGEEAEKKLFAFQYWLENITVNNA